MFNLHAGIDLHEVNIPVLVNGKFHSPHIAIVECFRGLYGQFAYLLAHLLRNHRRGTFLYEFLMTALHRAVTLTKVNNVSLGVSGYLDLYMTERSYIFLHVQFFFTKSGLSFPLSKVECVFEFIGRVHYFHPAPASAMRCLQYHGKTNFLGKVHGLLFRLQHSFAARNHGYPLFREDLTSFGLVTTRPDILRGRTDERNSGRLTCFCKMSVLGEKSVPGMNGRGIGYFSGAQESGDVEITVLGACWTDAYGFVGKPDMHCFAFNVRKHGHCCNAHLAACTYDTNRDLATVGYQYFIEHGPLRRLYKEKRFTVFHRVAVFHQCTDHSSLNIGLDLVHELHGLDDAQDLPLFYPVTHLYKLGCVR